MAALQCTSCETPVKAGARFCPKCGTAVSAPAAAAPPAAPSGAWPTVTPQPVGATSTPLSSLRLNIAVAGMPLEIVIPIALFAIAGVYLIQFAIRALVDAFRVLSYVDGQLQRLFLVVAVVIFLVLALGVALLLIAWLIQRLDPVGRGLAYVVVACLSTLVIFGDGSTTGEVLSLIGGLVAVAILASAPAVRDALDGPNAKRRSLPTSICVAQISIFVWIALLLVAATLHFVLADISGKYVAVGVLELIIALGALALVLGLSIRDRTTRAIISVAAVLGVVMLLIGRHDAGFTLLIGLTAAIPAFLWLPRDARAFYGDGPLVVTSKPAA
jgi:hypothetical protein